MIFAVAGHLNSQAKVLLGNSIWRKERLGNESYSNIDLEILDLDKILSRIAIPHTPALMIKFDGNVIERVDATTNKKSIIGHVWANDLVAIIKNNKEALLPENPGQAFGANAPTHKAVHSTLSNPDARKKFWKLNNGITAVCTSFSAADGRSLYSTENFNVVNGRQTLYTLENTAEPINDVLLLVSMHEVADDKERSQIIEATNAQNPISPADLIANYPEMADLVSQCRKNFSDFYFERQTNGFAAAKKSTQNRVTQRRVMNKCSVARAYYAYAIDPNEAAMPDKVIFSATSDANYYDRIFNDRDIRELIIPHIFSKLLSGLHKKWCRELKDSQSNAISRDKGIISKDIVKYYILKFIYESMLNIDDSTRQLVKDRLIEEFRRLGNNDENPEILESVAQQAYNTFMTSFDMAMDKTWPPRLREKTNSGRYKYDEHDEPSPYEIMDVLTQNGEMLLPHLLRRRKHAISQLGDKVQEELLRLAG